MASDPRLSAQGLTDLATTKRAGQTHDCGEDQIVRHGLASVHVTVFCDCGCAWRSTDASIALGMAEAHIHREEVRRATPT